MSKLALISQMSSINMHKYNDASHDVTQIAASQIICYSRINWRDQYRSQFAHHHITNAFIYWWTHNLSSDIMLFDKKIKQKCTCLQCIIKAFNWTCMFMILCTWTPRKKSVKKYMEYLTNIQCPDEGYKIIQYTAI